MASPTQEQYDARKAQAKSAFNSMGVSTKMVEDYAESVGEAVGEIVQRIAARAHAQLAYDLTTNIPTGIKPLTHGDEGRSTALGAVVTALGQFLKWDVLEAREFAARLLEDVNDHGTAANLYELAKGDPIEA